MNILYCHNDYIIKQGGEYKVYEADIKMLTNNGHMVYTYCKNNDLTQKGSLLNIIRYGLRAIYNLKTYKEISDLIRVKNIDIAIVQNTYFVISPSIYFVLKKHKIPVLQMIYNYRFVCPNAHLYKNSAICELCVNGNYLHSVINKCCQKSLYKSFAYMVITFLSNKIYKIERKIDEIIVPDNFLKNKLIEGGYNADKINVIKNPYIIKYESPARSDKGYFLYVGRIIRQKGIYTLIKSACILLDIRFIIIGEGEAEKDIRKIISEQKLDNVEFKGALYNDEMQKYIEEARAIIVPSEWYDNYPVIVSQSYEMRKPVIASDIDGIPEIVQDNVTGLLFRPGNVNELCEKIRIMYENKEMSVLFGNNGREYLEDKLSVEVRMKHLTKIINKYKRFPSH